MHRLRAKPDQKQGKSEFSALACDATALKVERKCLLNLTGVFVAVSLSTHVNTVLSFLFYTLSLPTVDAPRG